MKVEVQDDNCFVVELTEADMNELDITYENLDYANIETRRVLWTVLDEASQKLGRNINLSEKMLIEAMPSITGGCIIFFTALPKTDTRSKNIKMLKRDEGIVICEFENIENVFLCGKSLINFGYEGKSELYSLDGKYRLTVYPEPLDDTVIRGMINEFGEIIKENRSYSLARMSEYWSLIAQKDALHKLCNTQKN